MCVYVKHLPKSRFEFQILVVVCEEFDLYFRHSQRDLHRHASGCMKAVVEREGGDLNEIIVAISVK